jgi:hypothetical protein
MRKFKKPRPVAFRRRARRQDSLVGELQWKLADIEGVYRGLLSDDMIEQRHSHALSPMSLRRRSSPFGEVAVDTPVGIAIEERMGEFAR